MSFGKSDPPQPPNPVQVAGAQTSTNVGTAVANAFLNNTNQVTPTGSLTYDPTSFYDFTDPTTNQTFHIPRFTATQTLSPAQQQIQSNTQQAQTNLSGLAAQQSGMIGSLLGSPLNLSGAPGSPNLTGLNNLGQAQTSFANTGAPITSLGNTGAQQSAFGDAGAIQTGLANTGGQQTGFADVGGQQGGFGDAGAITGSYGPQDSFSADRNRIQQEMFQRLQPQLDLQQEQLRQNLADQGIRYGSPAYTAAMDNYNRQLNDLRLGVSAQAGTEQQRLSQMAEAQAQFQNAAQQQAYQEALGRGTFANTAQQAAYQQALGRGQFANAAQQAAYQQALGTGQFANAAQEAAYQQALGRGTFANTAQQQAFQQALAGGQFANTAQQNAYQQALGRANFANAGLLQQAQLEQARINAQQAARANYLQEQYAYRQEPINEISALLSQGQVSRPNFVTTPQTTIPTTDIAGLINQNFQQQFANYQAQNQQQQQTLGGLLGLGGNLALAGAIYSDRRIKENITRMGSVFAASDEGERKELPIYSYSFKADPQSRRHVGPMAQDVEKIQPDAVGETLRGVKYIRPRMVMGSIMRAA